MTKYIIFLFSIILNIIFIALYISKFLYKFNELTFKESECLDSNSLCSVEIKKRFNKYVPNIDDFKISGKRLNMMNVIILPDNGKDIANYNYINKNN
jgi:hypothetical protein